MSTSHLDDVALSAAIDGDASAAEVEHLSNCTQCQARRASLAAVAQAVGAPVLPRPPKEVDAAIERALAGWESPDTLVDARPPRRGAKRGGGPPKWLVAAAGVAAAVIVVGGVIAVARTGSGHTSATATFAGPSNRLTVPPSTEPVPGTTSGGDLGDQSDPAVVARLVMAALSQGASNPAAATGAGTTTAPDRASPSVVPPTACVAQARAAVGLPASSNAKVRFLATLQWRGQAAVVVAFSGPDGLAGVVMKTAGCSALALLAL